jgi:hypothetical protein
LPDEKVAAPQTDHLDLRLRQIDLLSRPSTADT